MGFGRGGRGVAGPAVVVALAVLAAGCADGGGRATGSARPAVVGSSPSGSPRPAVAGSSPSAPPGLPWTRLLAGMPPPLSATNIYSATAPGRFSRAVAGARTLVYVPENRSNQVEVIDPTTFTVVDRFPAREEPQHVVPSYDLKTLYVAQDRVPGGGLIPIDPTTGRPGRQIPVPDVYNLYFTPDGRYGVVVAEEYRRLDFYDPHSWQLRTSVSLPECAGVNHLDFTADGRQALIACEFANRMEVLEVATLRPVRSFALDRAANGMPQDTRLAPDGRTFYVADMMAGGVYLFNGDATAEVGFLPTGRGAHGIYFSRDGARMFVTNRDEGSVTVVDPATARVTGTWSIPGGGSPDMGAVSADGSQLWLSGRYHAEVYVLSTVDGRLLARIPVGSGPHGLTFWPQPGRYSLGHTSNLR
jgi:YVTN family beta-propeller protein